MWDCEATVAATPFTVTDAPAVPNDVPDRMIVCPATPEEGEMDVIDGASYVKVQLLLF